MEKVVELGATNPQIWLDSLSKNLARRPGYVVEEIPGRISVSRSYISDNRLVGAVFLGLATAGAGLLLLARRDKEAFTVTLGDGSSATNTLARVSGEWSSDSEALILSSALEATTSPGPSRASTPEAIIESAPPPDADRDTADIPPAPAEPTPLIDATGPAGSDDTRRISSPAEIPVVFELLLDDGEKWTLAASNIIGRAPSSGEDSVGDAQLIEIVDPSQSVSKSHARLVIESGVASVVDLHSTNGTVVVLPDGERVSVDPDSRVTIPAGASVEIGERRLVIRQLGGPTPSN